MLVSDNANERVFSDGSGYLYIYDENYQFIKQIRFDNVYQSYFLNNGSSGVKIDRILKDFPSASEIEDILGHVYSLKGIVYINGKFQFLIENLENLRLYLENEDRIYVDTGIPFNYFSEPMFKSNGERYVLRDVGLEINLTTGQVSKTNVRADWNRNLNSCYLSNSISISLISDSQFAVKIEPSKKDKNKIALVFGGGPLSNPMSLIDSGYVKYLRAHKFITYLVGYPGQIGFGPDNIKAASIAADFASCGEQVWKLIPEQSTVVFIGLSFGYVPMYRMLTASNDRSVSCVIAVAPLLKLRRPSELYSSTIKVKYQEKFENIHLGVNESNRNDFNKLMTEGVSETRRFNVAYYFGKHDILSRPGDLPKGDHMVKMLDGDHNWVTLSESEIDNEISRCDNLSGQLK
ncbi:hypothetical protein [Sphingomonas sp. 28-62-11]|uniref:hypothetical protein n=1 Tax=Sphingomonas sp. 28-62-11 TaxID=1970432 RepID=UPI0035A8FC49